MMNNFAKIQDFNPAGKRVLVRVDINAPVSGGIVQDDTRLRLVAPGLRELAGRGAKVLICAHFDRPKGKRVPEFSLAPLVKPLAEIIGKPVAFCEEPFGEKATAAIETMKPGDILMLENIRFEAGEEKNAPETARALAALADVYVNDAFSVAHRAHASTEGVARLLPAYAGPTMMKELDALQRALGTPKRPLAAVVGGAKVSTKIDLLQNLTEKTDMLVIGGGMANTFLAAKGYNVGKSLCEKDHLETARKIMNRAKELGVQIILPRDVVVAKEFKANAEHRLCDPSNIAEDEMILDAGPETVTLLKHAFAAAKTVIWNGPLGAFEMQPFDAATVAAAKIVADLSERGIVTSVAGGGDTVAALNHAGVADKFGYVSGAGGAFLEWMEGKTLPGVAALVIEEKVAA